RNLGAEVVISKRFLDHHRFTNEELSDLNEQASGMNLEFLVTTEKDAVRIPKDHPRSVPLFYLRLEIEILSGDQDFEKAVSRICFPENPTNLSFNQNRGNHTER
ncbi:MAG: tetraacyldisaccharide 4'-kinase, partial [Verrucomicrobiae bacterium]|nr:tetraacyldisaccharide 4'-kinase [Verrucomicrobiae bacterium]